MYNENLKEILKFNVKGDRRAGRIRCFLSSPAPSGHADTDGGHI